jgi:hypothetical protein
MIVRHVFLQDFRAAFLSAGKGANFSQEALELLYDHITESFEDYGSPYVLDVLTLCCDFNEQTAEQVAEQYNVPNCDEGESLSGVVEQYLKDSTTLVGKTRAGTFVFGEF